MTYENTTIILLLFFIVITFIQLGIDKILDWKGTINWLKSHFSKTYLVNMMPLSLCVIFIVEILAGILCLAGIIKLFKTIPF